jgi:anaerobic selenocysteine-containing dehydrogenase
MLVSCSNPLLSYANTNLVYKALKTSELLVTMDITWTPTAAISDYVLPAACWMERADMGSFSTVGGYPIVQLGEAAVPACVPGDYERWNDYEFWRELGVRLGQEKYWPWKTFEEVWEYRTAELMEKESAENLSDFIRKKRAVVAAPDAGLCEKGPLATPSGKVELYSTILEQLKYDPVPDYIEPSIPEEIRKKYTLTNISGVRVMPYHHSEFRHVNEFRRRHPDPIVEIHFDTARKKGIVDGDWVFIETPLGRIRQKARLSNSFHPRFIVTQHAWWFPENDAKEPSLYGLWESNINVTTDDDPEICDPLSGGWPFKGQLMRCRIVKE